MNHNIDLNLYTGRVIRDRGKKIFNSGKVLIKEYNLVYQEEDYSEYSIEASVDGTKGEKYDTLIDYVVEDDEYSIIGGSCSCPYGSFCKHLVATVLAANDYELYNNSTTISSTFDENFIVNLKHNILEDIISLETSESPYKLGIKFSFDDNIKLGLTVSENGNKPYIVKNVFDFLNYFTHNIEFSYGKNLSVIHDANLFENKETLNYILEIIKNNEVLIETLKDKNENSNSYYYSPTFKYEKKVIPITSRELVNLAKLVHNDLNNNISVNSRKIDVSVAKNGEGYICKLETSLLTYQFFDNGIIIFNKNKIFINEFSNKNTVTFLKRLLQNNIIVTKEEIYNFEKIVMSALKDDLNFSLHLEDMEVEVSDIEVKIDYKNDIAHVDIEYDNTLIVDEKKVIVY